jgi:hypothetical protein
MQNLTDLKKLLEQKFEIIYFNGMWLHTIHGKWGMAMNEYYLNHTLITRQQIKNLLK